MEPSNSYHFERYNYYFWVPSFETERLYCRPLTLSEYENFAENLEPEWQDLTNPYKHLIEGPSPLKHRIPRVQKDPNFAEIGLILAIAKNSRILIGSAGFHDFPDETGMIEIGFGIVPQMQGLGYGQELLIGMWRMIAKNPLVRVLRYTVSPENSSSLHIIRKMEFLQIGEQIDEEDGLELIFELPVEKFLEKFGGDERI